MPSFTLRKWYMDGVDAQGEAFIAYWASLSWRGLSLTWQSISSYPRREGASIARRSLRASDPPKIRQGAVCWNADRLQSTIAIESRDKGDKGVAETLWRGDRRRVDWRCVAPVGRVNASFGNQSFMGVGYAERLTMTMPPWRLPFEQLRWGRWCDDVGERSLVWITWVGSDEKSWVYLDGHRVDGQATADRVSTERTVLELSPDRILESRQFSSTIRGVATLARLIPRRMRDMREEKWLSNSALQLRDGSRIPGTSIHEVVTMG